MTNAPAYDSSCCLRRETTLLSATGIPAAASDRMGCPKEPAAALALGGRRVAGAQGAQRFPRLTRRDQGDVLAGAKVDAEVSRTPQVTHCFVAALGFGAVVDLLDVHSVECEGALCLRQLHAKWGQGGADRYLVAIVSHRERAGAGRWLTHGRVMGPEIHAWSEGEPECPRSSEEPIGDVDGVLQVGHEQ